MQRFGIFSGLINEPVQWTILGFAYNPVLFYKIFGKIIRQIRYIH
jgi:hypothetical protein